MTRLSYVSSLTAGSMQTLMKELYHWLLTSCLWSLFCCWNGCNHDRIWRTQRGCSSMRKSRKRWHTEEEFDRKSQTNWTHDERNCDTKKGNTHETYASSSWYVCHSSFSRTFLSCSSAVNYSSGLILLLCLSCKSSLRLKKMTKKKSLEETRLRSCHAKRGVSSKTSSCSVKQWHRKEENYDDDEDCNDKGGLWWRCCFCCFGCLSLTQPSWVVRYVSRQLRASYLVEGGLS